MVKVGSVAVGRVTPLHGPHGSAPHVVDHVLAQIVRERMDLTPAVSNKVNMVRAVQRASTPGHEDHLHDVGDPQVIAANHLNIPKCPPPRLASLVAMHETFVPSRLVTHSFTGGHAIGGEIAQHALLAPNPAEPLVPMHRHPPVVAPRKPSRGMLLRPNGAHVGRNRLANLGWFFTMRA